MERQQGGKLTITLEHKTDENVRDSYSRLFPTDEELDVRLREAMRVPVKHCMTKEQLLERMSTKK